MLDSLLDMDDLTHILDSAMTRICLVVFDSEDLQRACTINDEHYSDSIRFLRVARYMNTE